MTTNSIRFYVLCLCTHITQNFQIYVCIHKTYRRIGKICIRGTKGCTRGTSPRNNLAASPPLPPHAPLPLPPSATTPLLCHRAASAVASAAFAAAAASAAASVAAVAAAASVAASVSASSSVLCRRPLPLCPRPLPLSPPRRHFCRLCRRYRSCR